MVVGAAQIDAIRDEQFGGDRRQELGDAADFTDQARPVAFAIEPDVKPPVQVEPQRRLLSRPVHLFLCQDELLDIVVRQARHRETDREPFERCSDLKVLLDLRRREVDDGGAPVRAHDDEALGIELPQGFAHRHSADEQCIRDLGDIDALARPDGAREDLAPYVTIGLVLGRGAWLGNGVKRDNSCVGTQSLTSSSVPLYEIYVVPSSQAIHTRRAIDGNLATGTSRVQRPFAPSPFQRVCSNLANKQREQMSPDTIDLQTHADLASAQTAHQEAYAYIRRQILSGEFRPGYRINPGEIARTLSISRMPVRDALRQLDSEGLVVMRPNRGARVVDLTPDEAEEYLEIRAVLEGLSAGLAAPRLTEKAIEDLAAAKDRMNQVQGDQAQWILRHREFHGLIQNASGRPNLTREIARVVDMLTPCIGNYLAVKGFSEFTDYDHEILFATLCSGDAQTVEKLVREHVLWTTRKIVRFMRERYDERHQMSSAADTLTTTAIG
jgi:DNA-binding GntR family transcriptional regulator